MNSYDENLAESPFLKKLIQDCPELYNGALKHKWTLCVPRSGTYVYSELSAFVFCSHVLIELKADDDDVSLYKTANNKLVSLDFCTHNASEPAVARLCIVEVNRQVALDAEENDTDAETARKKHEVATKRSQVSSPQHVLVLFEETIVSSTNECVRIVCIERPLSFKADEAQSQPDSRSESASLPERDENRNQVELDSFESAFDYLFGSNAFVNLKPAVDNLISGLTVTINSTSQVQFFSNTEASFNWLLSEIRLVYERIVTLLSEEAAKVEQSRPRGHPNESRHTSQYGNPSSKYVVDSSYAAPLRRPDSNSARRIDERCLRNAVEIYVMFTIYRPTIRLLSALTTQDDVKLNRLTRRLGAVRLEQVTNQASSELEAFATQLPAARIALLRIANAYTALQKIGCIKHALLALSTRPRFREPRARDDSSANRPEAEAFVETESSKSDAAQQRLMTTDQLLPLITYLVIKSDVPNWHAHLAFMKRLSLAREAPRFDENDFCVTTLEAALHFLVTEETSLSGGQMQQSSRLLFTDPLESTLLPAAHRRHSSTVNSESNSNSFYLDGEVKRRDVSRSSSVQSDAEQVESRVAELFCAVRDFDVATIEAILSNDAECAAEPSLAPPKDDEMESESGSKQLDAEREALLLSTLCHPLCDCEKCAAVHRDLATAKMKRERAEELRRRRATTTRARVNVNARDDHGLGLMVLHIAAYYGQADAADLLIRRYSANVNAVDSRGYTPLHVACQRDKQQICLLLLYHGANVNLADNEGNTPLHHCTIFNNESCLKALLNFSDTFVRSSSRPRSETTGDQMTTSATQLSTTQLTTVASDPRISRSVNLGSRPIVTQNGAEHSFGTKIGNHASRSQVQAGAEASLRLDAVNEAGDSVLHICARWSYETACRLLLDRLELPHVTIFDIRNRRRLTPAECASSSTILALLTDTQQTLKNRLNEETMRSTVHKPKRSVFAMSRSRTVGSDSSTTQRSKKPSLNSAMRTRAEEIGQKQLESHSSKLTKQSHVSATSSVLKQPALPFAVHSTIAEGRTEISANSQQGVSSRNEPLANSRIDELVAKPIDSMKPSEARAASDSMATQAVTMDRPPQREDTPESKPDLLMKDLSNKLLRAAADGDIPLVKYYLEFGGTADELEVLTLLNASRSSSIDKATFAHTPIESFMCHPLCQCEVCSSLHNLKAKRLTRVNPNSANADGFTCLHVASIHGHEDLARFVLACGADPKAMTKNKRCTAAHLACKYNQSKILRLLLDNNADPNACDVNGNTLLHYCAVCGSCECADVLIRCNATLNPTNAQRNTPLHEAVRRNQMSVALLLVQNGADVSARNAAQLSALDLASTTEMRSLLTASASHTDSSEQRRQPASKANEAPDSLEHRSLSPETRALLDTYVNVAQVVDDLHDAERIIAGMSDTIEVITECALAESQRAASELDSEETTKYDVLATDEHELPKQSSSDLVASQYRLLFDANSTTPLHS